ncbi:transmembrane protein 276-like [Sardina pilchardus]|uniref:transmembrane protein 276-like n=1 Tax=Sardina pilchardus TaxID=27697 RepID=UPI002E0E0079
MHDHFLTVGNIALCLVALLNAQRLFKVHRAPAVGFFLVACSAGLSALPSSPLLVSVREDLQWVAEVLGPAMVAFGFLWLSDDHSTAYVLLTGSALLSTLTDWLSRDGLTVMSRCMALSSLSCSLTVCLFAGNILGVLGSVALSLPAIVALNSTSPLVSPEAAGGVLKSVLIGTTTLGCWSIRQSLEKYFQDLQGWDRNNILT